MPKVFDTYKPDGPAVGTAVRLEAMLIGNRWDNLVIADSIESLESGIAFPILDENLIERLVASGIFPIGGGRFGYRYGCVLDAELAAGTRGYRYSVKNITFLQVDYRNKKQVIRMTEVLDQSSEALDERDL